VSYRVIFITACAQNVGGPQHECKRVRSLDALLKPLAISTFNNRLTQSGPLVIDGID